VVEDVLRRLVDLLALARELELLLVRSISSSLNSRSIARVCWLTADCVMP
jgi:hypothetical protein